MRYCTSGFTVLRIGSETDCICPNEEPECHVVRKCRVPHVRLRGCLPEQVISVVNRPCSDLFELDTMLSKTFACHTGSRPIRAQEALRDNTASKPTSGQSPGSGRADRLVLRVTYGSALCPRVDGNPGVAPVYSLSLRKLFRPKERAFA